MASKDFKLRDERSRLKAQENSTRSRNPSPQILLESPIVQQLRLTISFLTREIALSIFERLHIRSQPGCSRLVRRPSAPPPLKSSQNLQTPTLPSFSTSPPGCNQSFGTTASPSWKEIVAARLLPGFGYHFLTLILSLILGEDTFTQYSSSQHIPLSVRPLIPLHRIISKPRLADFCNSYVGGMLPLSSFEHSSWLPR